MAIDKNQNVREPVTLAKEQVRKIEDYRRTQTPIPSKAAAIRALIDLGLEAAQQKTKHK